MLDELICSEPNCKTTTIIPCSLPDGVEEVFYCREHAWAHGFCFGCGQLCAGQWDFDVPESDLTKGYCSNCLEEINAELFDSEDDLVGDWDDDEPYEWD